MAKVFRRRKRQRFDSRKKGLGRKGLLGKLGKRRPRLRIIRRDPFGNFLFLKRLLIGVLGTITYGRFNIVNRTQVEGIDYLRDLPSKNVLFVSNHQTYFADVMAMFHIFCSVKWKFKNINLPIYLLLPRVRTYYVAAEETMKKGGLLPKVLSYAGAVTIKRSWRSAGQDVQRGVDMQAPEKIKKALEDGWVVTFPQGTTRAGAPVRRGAAALIQKLQPTVVPVEIDGFRRAFDKK
ncbi:MAG: lysophospholipid acyltransferase family protein [Bacteroidota bacterium]